MQQFQHEHIYFGIYTKHGLDHQMAIGYGTKCELKLFDLLNKVRRLSSVMNKIKQQEDHDDFIKPGVKVNFKTFKA